MTRIALIGTGSQMFARTLIGDVLSYPALADSELALMDIDQNRLEPTREAVKQAVKLDPLTAAACTLGEIDAMVEELLDANAEWLLALE